MGSTTVATGALARAILETLTYSDLFDYPLTLDEVVHYLGRCSTAEEVRDCLADTHYLSGRIIESDGYLALRGRGMLIARRLERAASSDRLWQHARRFVRVLRVLPFVRMIAITGSLAMRNSAAGDDIDVLIVTAPHRVWLARACAVALVYVGKLCGDTLCPNYVISERALTLDKHTLFVAHEFIQMIPMYGWDVYQRMCEANTWIQCMLPNTLPPVQSKVDRHSSLIGRQFKRMAEWLLSSRLGDQLEAWEMHRKLRKFQSRLGRPDGDVILDHDHVKGHFDDYGEPVMRLYAERVAQLEL